jgi:ubiquinone biosynthesis protein UbiJ
MRPDELFAATVETALNRLLDLDPEVKGWLADLAGTSVALEVEGWGLTLYLLPHVDGIDVRADFPTEPDTRLRGTPLALMQLGRGGSLFTGAVEIAGDTELGRRVQALFQDLDLDWEELVSRMTGDVVAHQLGNLARGLRAWSRRAGRTLELDAAEYLQEEGRLLPARAEAEAFMTAVDDLRDDVARLEARIRRIAAHRAAATKP